MKKKIVSICLGLGIMTGVFWVVNGSRVYAAETDTSQYGEDYAGEQTDDEPQMADDKQQVPDDISQNPEDGSQNSQISGDDSGVSNPDNGKDEEKPVRYGWVKEEEDWFYFDSYGHMVTDKWIGSYYVKSDGKMAVSEWVEDGTYYVDANGVYQTGWLRLEDQWYYLNGLGEKQTGWVMVNGGWFYADPETGVLWEQRWLNDTYYLWAGGYMATGWQWIDGSYYYFYAYGGKATSRWIGSYYVKADGRMAVSEWVENGKYYVDANGVYRTGWLYLDGTWYYLNGSGAKQTGWVFVFGKWYYLDKEGKMVTGWLQLSHWYYLTESGAMVTGWYTVDDIQYYFDGSGAWSNYNFLGITRDQIVAELEAHRYDHYYLGTRYGGLSLSTGLTDPCMHPNGSPRWDGYVGLNCTGFVAFVIQKIGGNLNEIAAMGRTGSYVNACNWIDYAKQHATYYVYNSISALLASGNAVKGDILYCEPDWSKRGADCHIGIYWGDYPGHNQFWHQVDINKISHIYAGTPQVRYYIIKTGP